jgi:hypothetical protein
MCMPAQMISSRFTAWQSAWKTKSRNEGEAFVSQEGFEDPLLENGPLSACSHVNRSGPWP